MKPAAKVHQFQPRDIERVYKILSCSRAQLAGKLGVSRACVCRWEKGLRAPQSGDAARLRAWLGKDTGTVVDVFDLRAKLGMTQRVFGAQFGVSRQQVQKWESGKAMPQRNQLDKLVKLAASTATGRPSIPCELTPSPWTRRTRRIGTGHASAKRNPVLVLVGMGPVKAVS